MIKTFQNEKILANSLALEILQELKVVSTEKTMSNVVKIRSQSTKILNPGDFVISQ